jgi:4-hydroxybenzoate polyprenyltransferase
MMNRWWTYQQERFPLFQHGMPIAVFSFSAVGYSLLLRGRLPLQAIGSALIAFIVVLLFFLQLRIADEFKDFETDLRHHPDRPVPRGLVSLRELGIVSIGAGAIQLGLTLALGLPLLLLLAIVWLYLGLVVKDFFVATWLKAHPLLYLLSHTVILPLIALYATGCDWLAARSPLPTGLGWFLAVSFFNGMVIEIGRKIRVPKDEERGVETYSRLWGRQGAIMAWLGAIWFSTLSTLLAAAYIQFTAPLLLPLLLLLTSVVWVAWRFMTHPVTRWAARLELVSNVWTLGIYLSLGIFPVLLRGAI